MDGLLRMGIQSREISWIIRSTGNLPHAGMTQQCSPSSQVSTAHALQAPTLIDTFQIRDIENPFWPGGTFLKDASWQGKIYFVKYL